MNPLAIPALVQAIETAGHVVYNKQLRIHGRQRVDKALGFQKWRSVEVTHLIEAPNSNFPIHYVVTWHYQDRSYTVMKFNQDVFAALNHFMVEMAAAMQFSKDS